MGDQPTPERASPAWRQYLWPFLLVFIPLPLLHWLFLRVAAAMVVLVIVGLVVLAWQELRRQ